MFIKRLLKLCTRHVLLYTSRAHANYFFCFFRFTFACFYCDCVYVLYVLVLSQVADWYRRYHQESRR